MGVSLTEIRDYHAKSQRATKYITPSYDVQIWTTSKEVYIKNTLPNEWVPGWDANALKAGAVIIRSGVYWRVNRSVLGSGWPNNNCYEGEYGWPVSQHYYRTAPTSRGGEEQFVPNSSQPETNSAVDGTYGYHAERVSLPSDRPDKLVPLRYNSTIQNRTQNAAGTWLQRVRDAYLGQGAPGEPYDPNQECSQEDDQTSTDPTYVNY